MYIVTRGVSTLLLGAAVAALVPAPAAAQVMSMSECKKRQFQQSDNALQKRPLAPGDAPDTPRPWITSGNVVITCDDAQLFADEIEYYEETKVLKARGHVNFIEGEQRITADHLEFNTETKLGSFYGAQGIMTIAGKADRSSMFGATEADAYFYAEQIDKIGPDKYRLKNGRFTTCVQPTPRWEFEGSTVTLVKDRRALLWNSVLRVKNVPVFYLPFMYYPINKENRSTGFLMPAYGHSTLRGQTFSQAFFLTLGRSADAMADYEYSSKAGQGYGGEFRYVQAPGSSGNVTAAVFNGSSEPGSIFASRTFQLSASVLQQLPARLQLRGVIDYASDIRTQQVSQVNLYGQTRSTRSANVDLRGNFGRLLIDAQTGFIDTFVTASRGYRTGTAPGISFSVSDAPIGKTRIYTGLTGSFNSLIRRDDLSNPLANRDLSRFDINPVIRAPIGRLPYLSLTTQAGLRYTRWSEQLNSKGVQVPVPLSRQLFDLRASIIGPTFTRVFDTPGSGYATRWKHVVEPSVSIARTTSFQGFSSVARNDSVDTIFPGSTSISYSLANRLLAKRPTSNGGVVAREVASIQVGQTYYSEAGAGRFDTSYQSAIYTAGASNFSSVAITTNVQPAEAVGINSRVEYDHQFKAIRSISTGLTVNRAFLQQGVTWSKQNNLVFDKAGDVVSTNIYHALSLTSTVHPPNSHFNGNWSWTYDFHGKHQVQQRFSTSYMSQCCGVAVEYQTYNLGGFNINGLQQDRRFNLSFSLAGLGTFSNLFGSFSR